LALADREHISEALADLLADTREPAMIAALAGNDGAELSPATLVRLQSECTADPLIQNRLLRRLDLPVAVIERALGAIGERVGWSVIGLRRMSKAEARELVARLRDAVAQLDEGGLPEPSIERELQHKCATTALSPDDVVASLREGDLGRVEVALGLLASVDPARVRRLLYGADHRGLAALCARAGFAVPHYVALRMALDLTERALQSADPETAYAPEAIALLQRQYDQLRTEGTYNALCLAA
jgi:uncharacterized protein (DUF2336 family)